MAPQTGNGNEQQAGSSVGPQDRPLESMVIDCADCAVRGPACRDCVVSVLIGPPADLLDDERAALDVLAQAGLAPRLRLVSTRRHPRPGAA